MTSQLVVRIPEEQKQILQILASSKDISMGEITRQAIRDYLGKKKPLGKPLFESLAAIGKKKRIKNAPKDLSKNYKKYLYGK